MKRLYLALLGIFLSVTMTGVAQEPVTENPSYVLGDMLVQVLPDASIRQIIDRAPDNFGVELDRVISRPVHIYLVKFDHQAVSHRDLQYWLLSQPEVEYAENNSYVELRATTPGDPSFNQQWHHVNNGGNGGVADADIDSDEAWDITTGGTTANGHDIVIALIESGNLDHPDIDANRWTNTAEIPNNGQDDDNNGYVDDYDGWNPVQGNDDYGNGGHGTNCLGMMGAVGNNNTNVVGANWNVKLMVIGDYNINTQANAIAAYTYPYEMRVLWNQTNGAQGAFVVATSSSWGIDGANPNSYPMWCNFYTTMGQAGILNVGATTNQNLDVDTAGDMPTACASDYMIGVGRTDNSDNTAGGYGDQTIEFGAPGIDVVTTANGGSGITTTTGTSFSCPLTAGVIGLAYSIPCNDFMNAVMANPQQGADMVLQALLDGVDQKPQLSTRFITGGRLNSFNTLNELMAVACSGSICLAPSGISAGSITDNSASISFTPYNGATSQTLYWREVGAPTWTVVNNATSPVALTNLSGCTNYEYYMESDCGGTTSNPSSTSTFSTTGCGNCVDLGYCDGAATDAVDEWIETLTIGTYTNGSGNDNGYGDYIQATTIDMDLNATYNVSVTPGWGGTQYDEYTRIWIDLNQNGTFENGEIVYDQGTASQTAATGSITIPANATPGNARMRIQMAYVGQGQTQLPAVCGDFQWGEVEDYCVNIVDPNSGGGGGTNSLTENAVDYVTVYPNPTTGMVNFAVTNKMVHSVEVVDVVGQVISTRIIAGQSTQIDLGTQSNGTYFYRLKDENGAIIATDKLIVSE